MCAQVLLNSLSNEGTVKIFVTSGSKENSKEQRHVQEIRNSEMNLQTDAEWIGA